MFTSEKGINQRSSRPDVFCEKGVLRNFAKFTGKHLCLSLFLNKIVGLRPATLIKKRLWHRVSFLSKFFIWIFLNFSFLSEFCEISKNTFFDRTPQVAVSVCHTFSINQRIISRRKIKNFFPIAPHQTICILSIYDLSVNTS